MLAMELHFGCGIAFQANNRSGKAYNLSGALFLLLPPLFLCVC